MPYIGNQNALAYTSFSKQDFTTSATTSYTLDFPVTNENEIALFINFVRQEPTTAYTASGVNLTLTSATSATDDMYCVFLGKALQTVNPPAGSVGISQLSATGTKDSTTFLRGDNTFDTPPLGGITVADQWRITSNQTLSDTSTTAVTANWEQIDTTGQGTIGTAMTQSSGVFTFPSTGIYSVEFNTAAFNTSSAGDVRYFFGYIYITTDNSTYNMRTRSANGCNSHGSAYWFSTHSQTFVDVTDTSLVKVKFYVATSLSTSYLSGDTDRNDTTATFIRLGDT